MQREEDSPQSPTRGNQAKRQFINRLKAFLRQEKGEQIFD